MSYTFYEIVCTICFVTYERSIGQWNNGMFSKLTRLAIQVVFEQHVHVVSFNYCILFQTQK